MKNDISGPLSAKEIFTMAPEFPDGAAREAWLDQQCRGDAALRQKVEELLIAAGQQTGASPLDVMVDAFVPGDTLLSSDVDGQAEPSTQSMPEVLERRKIGSYKLLEQIGQGGFGTVYMAEQTVPVRRKVALKILKPGMDSRDVIARFEAERQALAMMDHPNIARIYDGGTTDSGRPYFVMELVRGIPVTAYCDEARLTTDERLALFIDICRAVQHAHQKGIIHRDLKPSNVLVTMHDDKAVVKVIDFGIAKALSQQLTDRTLFTGYQQMLGTPLYMSPEQAQMSGIDIDTRTDVYSLGVMLYELLTGTTPFDKESLAKASFDDMRRIIREQEPPRPSARITTMQAQARSTMADRRRIDQRRVSDQLRGELDWIVMKALEKDRNRRYESASAFAADVQRYLDGDAVEACPPTALYRLEKFATRNRGVLTTVCLLTLTMIIGTGVSLWQAVEATAARQLADDRLEDSRKATQNAVKERERATENYVRARDAVKQMLTRVADQELSPIPEMAETRRRLLEDAAAFYTELLKQNPHDPKVYAERGQVFNLLGKFEYVRADLEKATELEPGNAEYHRQLAWFLADCNDTKFRDSDAAILQAKWAAKLAPNFSNSHNILGKIYLFHKPDALAAEKAFLRASQLSNTQEQKHHLLLMAAYAARRYREVVKLSRNLNPEIPDSLSFYMCVAQAHIHLGEYEEALAASTQALATARIGRADSASQPAFHIHMQLADIYVKLRMFREALAHLDQALKLAPFRWYAHSRRPYVHFELRHYPETLADMCKAIELNPADLSALTRVSIERIAACPDEAFRRGFLVLLDRAVELNHQSPASVKSRAKCRMFLGDPKEAWRDLRSLFTPNQSPYPDHYEAALLSLEVADREFYTSACKDMLQQFASVEDVQARQYTAWTCALAPNAVDDYTSLISLCRVNAAKDPTSLQFVNDLGAVLLRAGHYPEARQWLEQARTMTGSAKPYPTYSNYLLAITEYHLGNKEAAQQQLQKANILAEKEFDGSPVWNRRLTIELLRREAQALIGDLDE